MRLNGKINLFSRRRIAFWLVGFISPWLLFSISVDAADTENMQFSGELVSTACKIVPPEDIQLDPVVDKYIYNNIRTHGTTFTIQLVDCDLAISDRVKITFSGDKNLALPGLLAVSGIKGIGVGLEDLNDKPIKLDEDTLSVTLNKGATDLIFKAYIQGEPEAIKARNIGLGSFSAIATFNLVYP